MNNLENRKKKRQFIVTVSFILTSIAIAFILASRSSQPAVAQVVDWCSQPGILWCTSHEEFATDRNLPSNTTTTPSSSWYAPITPISPTPPTPIPGGGVDRNDDQYLKSTPAISTPTVEAGLLAKIVAVSTSIPARSGEISGKKYVELSADTKFADEKLKFPYNTNKTTNAGIFLSRKVRGLGANLASLDQGLYFSAWYRFPYKYKSTTTANNNLMVMEFMTQLNSDFDTFGNWRVPWSIHLNYDSTQDKMFFRLDERSGSLHNESKNAESNTRDALNQHTQSTKEVPVNKWVHLEVFYKYGAITGYDNPNYWRGFSNGAVIVFQDGIEIFRFENVATTAQAADWVSDRWMVTAYAAADGAADTPSNSQTVAVVTPTVDPVFKVLVDDAAISSVRLGAAREQVRNGDFTNNGLYWRRDNSAYGNYVVDNSAGLSASSASAAKISVTNVGAATQPTFYQPIKGGMRPGVPYTLRFSAKTNSSSNRNIQLVIRHNGYAGPYNEIEAGDGFWTPYWDGSSCGTLTLTQNVQNFVCPLSVSQVVTNGILSFWLGGSTTDIWIDNVSLVENQNLIPNGDFDGAPAWLLSSGGSYTTDTNAGLSFKNGNGAAGKVTVNSTGGADSPELYQPIPSLLDPGISYTLRFTAKSSIARNIQVAIHNFDDPSGEPTILWWESNCGMISLTANQIQNYVCTFQPGDAELLPSNKLSLGFLLGDAPTNNGQAIQHDVWIDNVSLSRNQ